MRLRRGQEGWGPLVGISSPMSGGTSALVLSLSIQHVRRGREVRHLQAKRGISPEPCHAGTLIGDFQSLQHGEKIHFSSLSHEPVAFCFGSPGSPIKLRPEV